VIIAGDRVTGQKEIRKGAWFVRFQRPAMTSNFPRRDAFAPATRNLTRCSPTIQSEAPYPDFMHGAWNLRAAS